jgi:hypothetical protein
MVFMKISKELHATAKSLHVSFSSWQRTIEDQDELQNGNRCKAIPIEMASVSFAEEVKQTEDFAAAGLLPAGYLKRLERVLHPGGNTFGCFNGGTLIPEDLTP